jgi:ELWxxDGT repeat protein
MPVRVACKSQRSRSSAECRTRFRRASAAAVEPIERRLLLSASLLKDLNLTSPSSAAGDSAVAELAGAVYFIASSPRALASDPAAIDVWRTDGTDAGTTVAFHNAAAPVSLTATTNALYFIDGTGGPRLLYKLDPAAHTATALTSTGTVSNLTSVGGTLFFTYATAATGTELFKTDGTTVELVKDINPGTAASSPGSLKNLDGTLYFAADDGTNGVELWKSDGTPAGTVLVKDVATGASSGSPIPLATLNGQIYFSATTVTEGRELWRTDASAARAVRLGDLAPGATSSNPQTPVEYHGALYFAATTLANGQEFWKTNGSLITLAAEIRSGSSSAGVSVLGVVGDRILLWANDGGTGAELWTSDGTAAGTQLLKDVRPGAASSAASNNAAYVPPNITGLAGGTKAIVYLDDGVHGGEPWVTDGTTAGTTLLSDLYAGIQASAITSVFSAPSGRAYFTADDGTGAELWTTDGTAAGTRRLHDIVTFTFSSNPDMFFATGDGRAYVNATVGRLGSVLHITDGTPSGTTALGVGVYSTNPWVAGRAAILPGGVLLYTAQQDRELWRS